MKMKLWIIFIVTTALQITFVSTGTIDPKARESEEELSQNRPRCDEKRGKCIPMDAPCRGRAMVCCDYCLDEDNYKCCIDMCYTYQPCSSLGGNCISQHEECHGIGVNVENGCSVENSLNCTCCVPHSQKALIKDQEKADEKTATFAKAKNQISPHTKKNSRTGKDLHTESMDELENYLINEETVLMEEKDSLMNDLHLETMEDLENDLINEDAVLMEENGDLMADSENENQESIAEDDIVKSNELSVVENDFLESEIGLKNVENVFSTEENDLENGNNELIDDKDNLPSEIEEIIAENEDLYESYEEIEGDNISHEENDNNVKTDVKYDNTNDEKTTVANNKDNGMISSNEALDNDYSFIEDENENNDDEGDENQDNIEYNDYEYNKNNEDKKYSDENEGKASTEADKEIDYEED